MTEFPPIAVIGAGSYGTALAIALSRNGFPAILWGRNKTEIETMALQRENQRFLPGVTFPEALQLESDLATTMRVARDILLVVPSHVFADVLQQIKPFLLPKHRIIWASKGLEHDSGRLLHQVAKEIIGNTYPLAVLSGPTFAKELAMGLPTAIVLSSADEQFAKELQEHIHCSKHFRVYLNSDMIGVQLGGAIKNVIAIGAGVSDGIGYGANARTALITRGLAEISRLGASLGAEPQTFMGMAGLGDLVLTCTDNQSRNRRFGMMIGQGYSVEQAMQEIGQVVEGYYNTQEAYRLAQRQQVEMPIVEQIYQMLFCGLTATEAARNLLAREKKSE
ncbi:glycerol-3-phosphate dehydrogenase [Gallibacterium salpingitidis]|uniref:Glycerol-3-phosphate dehydrogenase [NAD(P)+] n=1 Tax=Gallibacterium salpingitidis TaxID=505341 RepID=A0AB36E2A8_9PAST|nr:NAD(P)H-dependent glycerol-3-phosphate dehydrogenase [Gallibacterium salpingitidis]OBX08647.1 glycerol-3-phosphate dehydrogenase [Gallibacterium salpingitidis]OBX10235.1 glycerol-3-phosphate dehydrogenase [Gallibacterium salpingitidis]WKS99288.1 NAD(P)H-dependent glycerol-3-phosphate dehydrogenase [Gallibacterium salpingitidis]